MNMRRWLGLIATASIAGCATTPAPPVPLTTAPVSPTTVTAPPSPIPTRDEVVFTSFENGNAGLYAMFGDGSGKRRLVQDPNAALQPALTHDGRIAYVSYQSGGGDLYITDLKDTDPRRLTSDPALDQHPAWSPEGRRIAFSSHRDGGGPGVFIINADGSGEIAISRDYLEAAAPAWSPDGRSLAFIAKVAQSARIVVADLASGDTHLLTPDLVIGDAGKEGEYDPVWSPDGSQILYVHSGDRKQGINLHIAPAIGGESVALTENDHLNSTASFSPDGTQILYLSNARSEGGTMNVHVMHRDGTAQRNLSRSAATDMSARWSADGAFIYFMSFRDWPGQVYRMNAEGTGVVRLSHSATQEGFPVVRPAAPPAAIASTQLN